MSNKFAKYVILIVIGMLLILFSQVLWFDQFSMCLVGFLITVYVMIFYLVYGRKEVKQEKREWEEAKKRAAKAELNQENEGN